MSRQIIVKAKPGYVDYAAKTMRQDVYDILADRPSAPIEVTKVFPNQDQGNRARLFAVHLPDDLSDQDITKVLEYLRAQEKLEYAEAPSPREPMLRR
jgi:hypothetical protein